MFAKIYLQEVFKSEQISEIQSYFNFVFYQIIFVGLTTAFLATAFLINELVAT